MSKRYVNLLFLMGKKKNIHQLSREIDMTTSHLSNVTDQWHREGIIVKVKNGREVELELTKKGEEIVTLLRKYDSISKKEIKMEEVADEGKDQAVPSN